MLLLNLLCLFGACVIGLNLFKGKKVSYLFLLIPFVPAIFLDAGQILKDSIFSFGYRFIAMVLTDRTLVRQYLKPWQTLVLLGMIFYFQWLKYKPNLFFPFMVFWVVSLQSPLFNQKILVVIPKLY